MRVDFAPIIEGFLADYIIKLVYTAGMRNALVRVGGVFRGVGQAPNGPWMIEVQENFASAVQHALKLTVVNTGIASISSQKHWERKIWDYRSKSKGKPKCKGVVIVMNEAAFAQGVAHAVYTLGPQEGIKFLDKFGKARGLIVDAQGQFLRKGM
jgi:thiamine biosynthesis lipoprotein ApbE